ncbi:hypothetical protein H2199_001663 [Coniosporium tulheliwenetii]|uniref:Uncharacterized protein n=1 Tax=Coniosporium tulheliwenetii TaxID=3383036 RepID=A0ACC2ZJY0_9PEZI|nr:hypothetical protein H2199_001663 [Cladosporium sp. JES 115]
MEQYDHHGVADEISPPTTPSSIDPLPSSSTVWTTPSPARTHRAISRFLPFRKHRAASKRQIAVITILCLALLVWFIPVPATWGQKPIPTDRRLTVLRPADLPTDTAAPDPVRWLEKNGNNRHAVGSRGHFRSVGGRGRPRAALISLVRNSELEGIVQSMRQLEYHWNHKYNYPWIFFNDEPFSDEFKQATQNLTSARCYYEVVPKEHWSMPSWIDEGRFMNSLEYLGAIGVGKGWMISYRHMCRWNSGFFYKHPRLLELDFYWRVEPDVHFYCDIDYDVFRFMSDNKMKYGFNMNILDDARSFPSLWSRTRAFINKYPELLHPESDLDWLLDAQNSGDYNNCQFFSNFEIGDLRFFRGEQNEKYFDWLDKSGGFYYERFGDAPIHTLAVAMFVPKREIWFFRDIGYQHDINRCDPTSIDENFYRLVPFESPQKSQPIRWSQSSERAMGGDGYGGYEVTGL